MATAAKRSREVAVWTGWVAIATGIAAVPFVVYGSNALRVIVILVLSIITQLGTGAGTLFAAWAARDTDRLTPDD